MPAKPARNPLISMTAAAGILGVDPRTVRRYIADGRIKGYRLGDRLVRVDETEVQNLLRLIPTA